MIDYPSADQIAELSKNEQELKEHIARVIATVFTIVYVNHINYVG